MDIDGWLVSGARDALKIIVGGVLLWLWRKVRTFAKKLREVVEDHASARAVEERCVAIERRLETLERSGGDILRRGDLLESDMTDPNTSPRLLRTRVGEDE